MSVEENRQLARRYYSELMSNGDLSFVDRYMAPEFEFSNPTLARFLHPGTQALRLSLANHFLESLEQGMDALDFL